MRRLILTCILLAAPTLAQAQTSQTCVPVTEQQVKGFFDRWNASLKTLKPDEVLKNYASDAILLPTVSNQPRLTQTERAITSCTSWKTNRRGPSTNASSALAATTRSTPAYTPSRWATGKGCGPATPLYTTTRTAN